MLSKHAPQRVYYDGWEDWERIIWLWCERRLGGVLILYATLPWRKNYTEWMEEHRGPWCPFDWLDQQHEVIMSFVKKSLERAKEQVNPCGFSDAMFKGKWPALAEFMTVNVLDDGSKRELSRLTVFFEHGLFKCFLNDQNSRMSMCVSSATFLGLLDALEGAIKSDAPGWRPMPDFSKKGKK